MKKSLKLAAPARRLRTLALGLTLSLGLTTVAVAQASQPTDSPAAGTLTTQTPVVTANAATILSKNSAAVSGQAQDNGLETLVALQLGASPALPEIEPEDARNPQTVAANTGTYTYSHTLSGLAPGTTYYYRLVAKNSAGKAYSALKQFTTWSVPKVASIQPASPSPTNADDLNFTVEFTEGVSGVDRQDFIIKTSNTATGTISLVTAISPQQYNVSVVNVLGDGNLRLDLINNNTVTSLNGVALEEDYSWGNYFLVDNTPPAVKISLPSYPYTQISPISYTITYSDGGSGIDQISLEAANVTLNRTGTANGSVVISGTGSTQRKVEIQNISGDGTIGINLLGATAVDRAGNVAPAAGPSETFVVDNTVPQVTCPANMIVEAQGSACDAYVTMPVPDYSDNIGPITKIRNSYTGNANGSSVYPVGTTTVDWEVEDVAGNVGTCRMTVTVQDKTAPVLQLPANIIAGTDAGQCSAVVNYTATATDNCQVQSLTATNANTVSGSRFPLGETVVEYTAVDQWGNRATGSFTVTVVDDKGPVMTCLENIEVEAEEGQNGATVTFPAQVTAVDNCADPSQVTITQTAGLPSGSFFPSGSTVNTFEAVDAEGNKSTCSFTVTVEDTEAPYLVISAPSETLTKTGPVSYTITYYGADAITLNTTDVILNKTGTANGLVTVSGLTGNTRTVTVNSISGNGSLGISIAAGTATDLVLNQAPAAGPSQTFRVDNSAPQLSVVASASTKEDIPSSALAISLSDEVTTPTNLVLTVSANNPGLIAEAGLQVGGSGANRTLVVQPQLNASGAAIITLTVTDEAGWTSTKTLAFTVIPIADEPIVTTTPAAGPEDTDIALVFSAELQDTDGSEQISFYQITNLPEGAQLSAGTEVSPGIWQLAPAAVSSLTVRPAPNFVGTFTLQVRAASRETANHDQALSEAEDLVVTVSPVNDAPQFSLDATNLVLEEDFAGDVKVNVVDLADADTELDAIRFSLSPATVDFVNVSIDAATGEVTLTSVPNKNQATPFTFTVTANDGSAEDNTFSQSFTLVISPVNDAPQITLAPNPWVLAEDFTGTQTLQINLNNQPEDESGETITYSVNEDLAGIELVNLSFNPGTGILTANSVPDQFGALSLTLNAFDGELYAEPIELTIEITRVDDAPEVVLENPVLLTEEYVQATRTVEVKVPANETYRNFTYALTPDPQPEGIKVTVNPTTGELLFTEVDDDFFTDKDLSNGYEGLTYTLTVQEEGKEPITQEFLVVVENKNDAPEYLGETPWEMAVEGGADEFNTETPELSVRVDELFVDADGDDLVYSLGGAPSDLKIKVDGIGQVLLQWDDPEARCEVYEFQLIATDPAGLSASADIELKVFVEQTEPEVDYTEGTNEYSYGDTSFKIEFEIKNVTGSVLDLSLTSEGQVTGVEEYTFNQGFNGDSHSISGTFKEGHYGGVSFDLTLNYTESPCENAKTKSLTVSANIEVTEIFVDVPNIFTPNGDGVNDTWNILNFEKFGTYSVVVYDRRGKLLWQANHQNYQEWNGTVNGKELPEGEYFYRIQAEGVAPETNTNTYNGTVTIIY